MMINLLISTKLTLKPKKLMKIPSLASQNEKSHKIMFKAFKNLSKKLFKFNENLSIKTLFQKYQDRKKWKEYENSFVLIFY